MNCLYCGLIFLFQPTYVRDCNNVCQPQSFIGDGQCDDGRFGAVFNCALFTCDGGKSIDSYNVQRIYMKSSILLWNMMTTIWLTWNEGDCTCIGTSGQHTTGRFTTGWAPFTTGSLTS